MLKTWRNGHLIPGNLPVVFTEDNWTSDPTLAPYQNHAAEVAYLADLLTWLYDHDGQYHTRTPSMSPLRVLVYRGADDATPEDLGIYQIDGTDKPADGADNTVRTARSLPACKTLMIKPGVSYSIAHNYYYLRYAACYS